MASTGVLLPLLYRNILHPHYSVLIICSNHGEGGGGGHPRTDLGVERKGYWRGGECGVFSFKKYDIEKVQKKKE